MKRPLVWVFGCLLLLFLLARFFYEKEWIQKQYCLEELPEDSRNALATGILQNIEAKPHSYYLYLKKGSVVLDSQKEPYFFHTLLVIITNLPKEDLQPGNRLSITGKIQNLETPGNPGQFNEKTYYREKNIFYKFYASQIQIVNKDKNCFQAMLYILRQKISYVCQQSLTAEEAGIVEAMLLGDKASLDNDIREQYRKNGISHILAISGLHISILCTFLYQMLSRLPLPRFFSFGITVFFLFSYGMMTGFGVSVNRAVIMMLLMLFSKEVKRSYDPFTAMAVSAAVLLLQKPYAVFSCGFLLSYSAALGAIWVYPVLKGICFGTSKNQQEYLRRRKRKRKECLANSRKYFRLLYLFLSAAEDKILSSLFCSIAIWISTLPVILYFYYEIPTYGILVNLFVLPLLSAVVVLSLAGGILGMFCLSMAQPVFYPVHMILSFYRGVCSFFESLPCPNQIMGCPAFWTILLYFLALFFLLLWLRRPLLYAKHLKGYYRLTAFLVYGTVCFLLFLRPQAEELTVTALDVGQGDGIFLQTEIGKNILLDGGSTDVSQVGKYRLVPFLKYYGINHIDYMVMTHADSDHISGQLEIIKEAGHFGIEIGQYLLPVPDESCMDENYREVLQALEEAKIPYGILKTGSQLSLGKLSLLCLHPDNGFLAESANAYSTTLSLTYGRNSMLLTGDLEGNGEEAVLERIRQKTFSLPEQYDILKVAHHGSKNSTSEEFLEEIYPKMAVISCGKNNSYGHPHQELLDRLSMVNCSGYQTGESGAVTLYSNGEVWRIKTYRKNAET